MKRAMFLTWLVLCAPAWQELFANDSPTGQKRHWAYAVPEKRPVPGSVAGHVGRNPIDRFVSQKLAEHGIQPEPQADRRTLIRRLYLDLLGLPPSAEQVDHFISDPAEEAYERMVEQVLASPHFGERFAMFWLDLVRYGDTNGYHADVHRNVFPFRDYVIQAFNSNKPFDQFTVEQLAGDLLPDATIEQRVASGYNRMNMITTEGGAQAKEYLAKYAADRVRNASVVWLSSTVGCAECHDHKFDPFSAKDFYRFAAFFADVKQVGVYPNRVELDPQIKVPTAEQAGELERIDRRIAAVQTALNTQTAELEAAQRQWEHDVTNDPIRWLSPTLVAATAQNGTELTLGDDGAITASGPSPDEDTYIVEFSSDLKAITGLRIEALPGASLPAQGPGRADNGNFTLSHVQLEQQSADSDQPQPIALQNASASHEQMGGNLNAASVIDPAKKDQKAGWAVADQFGKRHQLVIETKEDARGDGGRFKLTLYQSHGTRHTLGHFRITLTDSPRPVVASATRLRGVPDALAEVVALPPDQRSPEQSAALSAHFRTIAPALEPARKEFAELNAQRDALDRAIPQTLITVAVEPAATRILPRGNWLDESGEEVTPGVPEFLRTGDVATGTCRDPAPETRQTRLELAHWLVANDNPLTARVFVNRIWKLLFGQGLVRTSEDFGLQGTPPTHPELLDWLAVDFIENGWDVKRLVRLIVMTDSYRRSSHATAELRRLDPYNYWLGRQERFRLDAELVRDQALAASGLLTVKLGGRSVKPYQPEGYWDHCNTFLGKLVYDQDHGEDLYRRGLYTYWKRTFLHPAMLAFDAPNREECTAERPRSNTPLQALVLLNDPTYVEAARVLAERAIRHGGPSVQDRITYTFRRVLARSPTPPEMQLLSELVQQHLDQNRREPDAAAELLRVGEWPAAPDIHAAELAAWTSIARIILNLHESITRL